MENRKMKLTERAKTTMKVIGLIILFIIASKLPAAEPERETCSENTMYYYNIETNQYYQK